MKLFLTEQFLFLIGLSCVSGARILALVPLGARSHHNFHQGVLKALANRGHEVVVYGPFSQPTPLPNYTDVFINNTFNDDLITYDLVLDVLQSNKIFSMDHIWASLNTCTEESLKQEIIQKLITSKEKFDLVIVEAFMGQEVFLTFGHIFKAPTIVFQPFGTFSLINKVMGNSLALPYVPEFNFPFSNKMSFYERLLNSYTIWRTLIKFYMEQIPFQESLIHRYLDVPDAPPLSEMVDNIALVFTNAHPIISYPQPLPPNIVPLGGIHLAKERKPLPKDIQDFLDGAANGVIYLSLGTCVPDHDIPDTFYQQFVQVFKNLKQRVLWKTRRANVSDVPNNVLIKRWVSQQDVLAHPNLVLFITHGGLLSLLEVSHAGVPVVGIPFFADQPMDVAYYEAQGTGVHLDFLSLSEETISTAINKVLSNPRYKENAVALSRKFQDVPMSQQELAVYWTEHVLRHGGAHLKPTSANLAWYQLMMLDIVAAILVAFSIVSFAAYVVGKMILQQLTKLNLIPCSKRKLD